MPKGVLVPKLNSFPNWHSLGKDVFRAVLTMPSRGTQQSQQSHTGGAEAGCNSSSQLQIQDEELKALLLDTTEGVKAVCVARDAGSALLKDYILDEEMGAEEYGGGGKVFVGRRRADGLKVIIKRQQLEGSACFVDAQDQPLMLESAVLASLGSSEALITRVPQFIAEYRDNAAGFLVTARPGEKSCRLQSFLAASNGGLPEDLARHFFQQAVVTITHAMEAEILLHDLRASNWMLDLQTLYLQVRSCQRVSHYDPNRRYTTIVAGPQAAAIYPPEAASDQGFTASGLIVYSLGRLLLAMLTGKCHCMMPSKLPTGLPLSVEVQKLLQACLEPEEGNRISFLTLMGAQWVRQEPSMTRVEIDASVIMENLTCM